MFAGSSLENCTDRSDACLNTGQTSSDCHDCDGLGSVGALPCGRCAGSGTEPTSPPAAAAHQGGRADYGAIWKWRSREWLLSGLLLRSSLRGESP